MVGDPARTRTPNLLIRSQLLYPVELRDRLRLRLAGPRGKIKGKSVAALIRWIGEVRNLRRDQALRSVPRKSVPGFFANRLHHAKGSSG